MIMTMMKAMNHPKESTKQMRIESHSFLCRSSVYNESCSVCGLSSCSVELSCYKRVRNSHYLSIKQQSCSRVNMGEAGTLCTWYVAKKDHARETKRRMTSI